MALRTTSSFWSVLYVILAVLVILALFQLVGVLSLASILANLIYTLTVIAFALLILHVAGLL